VILHYRCGALLRVLRYERNPTSTPSIPINGVGLRSPRYPRGVVLILYPTINLMKALRNSLYRRGGLGPVTVTTKYVSRGTGYGSCSNRPLSLRKKEMPQTGTPLFAHSVFYVGQRGGHDSDSDSSVAERFGFETRQSAFLVVSGFV